MHFIVTYGCIPRLIWEGYVGHTMHVSLHDIVLINQKSLPRLLIVLLCHKGLNMQLFQVVYSKCGCLIMRGRGNFLISQGVCWTIGNRSYLSPYIPRTVLIPGQ